MDTENILKKCKPDYYRVLQLKKDCNDLDIKAAFHRLAKYYNPERQRDENIQEVFALIAEAYQVLSDPLKRAIYDQYGETGLKSEVSEPNGHHIPYCISHEELLPSSSFEMMMNTMTKGVKIKAKPVMKTLLLSLREIYFGAMKKIKIKKLMFIDADETTTGLREKIVTAPIKPGIPEGTEIVFAEEGDQGLNRIPADLVFVTSTRSHEIYTREGDNLLMTVDIFLKDALLGTVVTVNTLDDRTLHVPITSIITPSYRKRISGEGLPIFEDPNKCGDLIINFNINFPLYLSIESKEFFKKAFALLDIK